MEKPIHLRPPEELDSFTIFLHFGLMLFGVSAWATGEWHECFKNLKQLGFPVHQMVSLGAVLFVSARLFHGFWGPDQDRFTAWAPYTPARLRLVFEDIRTLLTRKLPERPPRQGLAGLWEALGLMVFTWMSATGLGIFLILTAGYKTSGALHMMKELHKYAADLVPIYLAVHVSAVILHALAGDHRWRKMFFLQEK
jgi:cytochrome b